jgi:hypothetical protein
MIHDNKYILNSTMSNLVGQIESELEVTKERATSILYADALGVVVPYLMTMCLFDLVRNDVSKLINNKKEFIKLKKLSKYESDLEFVIDIAYMILNKSNSLVKDYNRYKQNFINNIFTQVEHVKFLYDNQREKLVLDDRVFLKKIKVSGEWNNKNIIGKIISKTKYFKNYFYKNGMYFKLPDIYGLSKNTFLEEELNNNFKTVLTRFLTLQFSLELNSPSSVEEINKIINDLKYFGSLCVNDKKKILFSHIAGIPTNTILNLSLKNSLSMGFSDMSVDRDGRYFSNIMLSWSDVSATLPPKISYQHYTSFNVFNNMKYLYGMSNIPIEWLVILDPKYYYLEFKTNKVRKLDDKIVTTTFPEIDHLEEKAKNKFSLVSQYWNRESLLDIYDNIRSVIRKGKYSNYNET